MPAGEARAPCTAPWIGDFEASVLEALVPDMENLLRRPVPPAPEVAEDMAQERLVAVVEALFKRIGQPTLLILEDQQWGGVSGGMGASARRPGVGGPGGGTGGPGVLRLPTGLRPKLHEAEWARGL